MLFLSPIEKGKFIHLTFGRGFSTIVGMKRVGLAFFFIALLAIDSYSFWIWTPDLGKWINPKNYVRDTPDEQFNLGYKLYQEKKYKQAIAEFEKLVRYFPKSKYAPESLYYIGRSYEKLGDYYKAFKSYQKIIDTYPYTARVDEVISLEYKIGNLYFARSNKRRSLLDKISFSDDNAKAIEIFQKVVENSPYGDLAPLAQFKLGLLYKRIQDYPNAEEAFRKMITTYPTSELMDDAIIQLAQIAFRKEQKVVYSQESTEEAIKRLEELSSLGEMPPEGLEVLQELKERKAESLYKIAQFYERQKRYTSALIYYEDVVRKYSRTSWAVKAAEKIGQLRNKVKK